MIINVKIGPFSFHYLPFNLGVVNNQFIYPKRQTPTSRVLSLLFITPKTKQ